MEFSKKPTQLVRHMHEVLRGYRKSVAAGDKFMVQVKEDGVFGFAIHEDGEWQIYGRTGKKLSNVEELERQFSGWPAGAVYIFEIVCQELSLEELSGVVNPNRTKPLMEPVHLRARLHDCVYRDDFLRGASSVPALERYDTLLGDYNAADHALCPDLSVISTKCDVDETRIRLIAEAVIDKGHEGIVIKRQEADWKAGRKNHESMKIVRGCDYDLQCIRVEEGLGKREGMVANAICLWRRFGEPTGDVMEIPVDLGKGFTDERRKELWADQGQIVGKIVEVHALQVGSQGSLRLPKVSSIRIDKTEADV